VPVPTLVMPPAVELWLITPEKVVLALVTILAASCEAFSDIQFQLSLV